jgi:hypothetical protein
MRVLLSTIGSRGDVQPLVALALQLRTLGQEVRMCVPPDFRDWIEGLGLSLTTIGPELRSTGKASPTGSARGRACRDVVAHQADEVNGPLCRPQLIGDPLGGTMHQSYWRISGCLTIVLMNWLVKLTSLAQ